MGTEVGDVIAGAVTDLDRLTQADMETIGPVSRDVAFDPRPGDAGEHPIMRPVYVGSCFGWLHSSTATAGGDVAVLICPGVSRDLLDAHHSLRILADMVAAAGYPAMRLDYPGIGDSADLDGDDPAAAEPWGAWRQGIHAALNWLRATTGASRVVLCGLRVGAALATLVAEQRDDVAGLILLAPVQRGRSYIQQLQMQVRLQGLPAGEGLEYQELRFGADTIDHVSAMDLRRARLPSGTCVAVFEQAASKLGDDCAAAWRDGGAVVHRAGFEGLEPLLRHNQEGEGTAPDFSAVLGWLGGAVAARPTVIAAPSWPTPSLARLGWIETPLRFGAGDRLFGILCRPDRRTSDMAVVIGNTGRDPHYGVARFGVEFARHLASLGVASLRIDFAGLGDSVGPPGKEGAPTSMFECDRTGDFVAAVDVLARLGYRRVAVNGNCSGAYHALRGALADPRVGTLLLVNLPLFEWQPGDSADFANRRATKPSHYLLRVGSRDAWSRLWRGSFDLWAVIRAQAVRLSWQLRAAARRLAERRGWTGAYGAGRGAVAALGRRGARTLFLFSPHENGLDAMEREFGRGAAGLRAYAGAELRIVPDIDHLLSTRPMRRTVISIMARFVMGPDAPAEAEAGVGGTRHSTAAEARP
jgi:alpha-beta hydrolase superfamily lysophospholipase